MGNETASAIGQPVPELPVADVERAQQHYRDALGFTIGWLTAEEELGAVSRGKAALFLRKTPPPFEPAVTWIFAEDVDATYRELKASGATIVEPLETKPWGMRQLTVKDLDGNVFHFHHDAPAERAKHERATAHPVLTSIAAQLFVADVARACDFYAEKLGFAVDFTYGDPPFYGQLSRDDARLALKLVWEPVFAGDVREREHLLCASITVATAREIEQLFATYRAAGISFHQVLETQPWGAQTFVVSDPDDNLVLFAGPASD